MADVDRTLSHSVMADDGTERPADTAATAVIISDDELAAEALAASPDTPIDDDATPFGVGETGPDLLPSWYMPAPRGYRRTPGRRLAVVGIIVALLVVNGAGLCVTYGFPEIAW